MAVKMSREQEKSLNTSYNYHYNSYINYILSGLDRKKAEIRYDPHALKRKDYWKLDLNKIREAIQEGKILQDKCEKPNKICFTRYYGKENITYVIIVRYHKEYIE